MAENKHNIGKLRIGKTGVIMHGDNRAVMAPQRPKEERKVYAERIVHCVNHFNEMASACKRALESLKSNESENTKQFVVNQLKKALKNAQQ